jgi:alkanesulfonate monooxygenase SsuD/methylene tetrahydromethanopterin reductase-like flavin-dependent oxidoreductase (luciferase family)
MEDVMQFGLCYIPDYHPDSSGSWQDWYDGMIAEVKLAETLGFESAWFAEHRVPGFAFGSPGLVHRGLGTGNQPHSLGLLGQPAAAE